MTPTRHRKLICTAGILTGVLVIIIILRCMLPTLLRQALNSKIRHIEHTLQVDIRTYNARFSRCSLLKGTFRFQADSISVARLSSPQNRLLSQGVSMDIQALKGLKKQMEIQHLHIQDISVYIPETADSSAAKKPARSSRSQEPPWDDIMHQMCKISSYGISIHSIHAYYHQLQIMLSQVQLLCVPAADTCRYTLQAQARYIQCQHRYISPQPVKIDSLQLCCDLYAHPHYLEADSASTLLCHTFTLHPYLRLSLYPKPHLVFLINERHISADSCFAALPAEQFQVLPQLKMNGYFNFYTLLDADMNHIDSLKFTFLLHSDTPPLRIQEGLEHLTRFNEEFEYPFYINDELIRTIPIGQSNPMFCPYGHIPPYLRNAILASEDASFFRHRGIITSSIQDALITDIKSGRLRRGGSTISMQLMKNLYLNRKKVLTRKLEEILLVWMIEEQHLLSKERMFEIYVNIIEWGPNIVGIGEAAEFYFHKRPADLTQAECIYLATLIRSPRHYASTLQADGTITEARQAELQFVARHMLERDLMTENEFQNFNPIVTTVLTKEGEK